MRRPRTTPASSARDCRGDHRRRGRHRHRPAHGRRRADGPADARSGRSGDRRGSGARAQHARAPLVARPAARRPVSGGAALVDSSGPCPTWNRRSSARAAAGRSATTRSRSEQGKLPVRERVERLVDPDSLRRGRAARQLGAGRLRRRRRGHRHGDRRRPAGRPDGQRPDGQGRLLGPEDGREDHPHPGAGARAPGADDLPGRLGRGAHHRPGADVPRPPRRRAHLPHRGEAVRASCRRCACCSARAPPAAPTSRPSATS